MNKSTQSSCYESFAFPAKVEFIFFHVRATYCASSAFSLFLSKLTVLKFAEN